MTKSCDTTIKVIALHTISILRSKSSLACFAIIVFSGLLIGIQSSASICPQGDELSLNTAKSISIVNCVPQSNSVSWVSWITSKSTSHQFHFLDLLELLSRTNRENA